MKTINGAVVGLGYWGPNLVRNFIKVPGVTLSIGADLKEKNLKEIAKSFPFLKTTTKIEDILQDATIEFVAIATPLLSHYPLAKKMLLAGKHVLLEKPMAQTSKQAKELIALAKFHKRILMIDHTFVYTEAVKKMKQIIVKKELGNIYYYDSVRINLGLIQNDASVVWDLAPHDLSIIQYLFALKPLFVQASGSSFVNKKREEVAHIFIQFETGMIAHIHVSWLSPVKIRTTFIGGSRKMIVYNDIEPSEKIKIYDKNVSIKSSKVTPFAPAYRQGDVVIPHIEQKEAMLTELEHFIDCIRDAKKPLTGGQQGLEMVIMLEAIDESLRTGRSIRLKYERK